MLTRKNLALLAFTVLLGGAAMWPEGSLDATGDLPMLAVLPADQVHRIEITKGQLKKVVMEGELDGGFRVVSPYEGPADTLGLRPLLRALEDGVRMDLRIDEGNLEDYGVDDQNGILVELFSEGDEVPKVSFVVGHNVVGGSSFVRLKDSDMVYRAKVGGRHRYDREVSDWRDRMVLSWDVSIITDVELKRLDGEDLHFQRVPEGVLPDGTTKFSDWELVGDRGFSLDQKMVTAVARNLGVLRSGEVLSSDYDAGWDPPASEVTLRTLEGASVTLTFGQDALEMAAFVRLDSQGSVYRVGGSARAQTLSPQEAFRNRMMFDIAQSAIASVTLEDIEGRRVLTSIEDGLWEVTEPRNVDADVKQILFTVNTLRELRADGIVQVDLASAGLIDPTQRMSMKLHSGVVVELLVGRPFEAPNGQIMHYVKRGDSPVVYGLHILQLQHLRKGFGRSD